jgi:hypothetical protein
MRNRRAIPRRSQASTAAQITGSTRVLWSLPDSACYCRSARPRDRLPLRSGCVRLAGGSAERRDRCCRRQCPSLWQAGPWRGVHTRSNSATSTEAPRSSSCSATMPAAPPPAARAGQRPAPPARRSAQPAPQDALPAPGSAHHADPRKALAAHRTQPAIIPETTQPRHQHPTRRRNVTGDHPPPAASRGPECITGLRPNPTRHAREGGRLHAVCW